MTEEYGNIAAAHLKMSPAAHGGHKGEISPITAAHTSMYTESTWGIESANLIF
jgi:hypothetical protein